MSNWRERHSNLQNFFKQTHQIGPKTFNSECLIQHRVYEHHFRGHCASTTGSIRARGNDGTTDHADQARDYYPCIVPGRVFGIFVGPGKILMIDSHLSATCEINKMCIRRIVEFVVRQIANFENSQKHVFCSQKSGVSWCASLRFRKQ